MLVTLYNGSNLVENSITVNTKNITFLKPFDTVILLLGIVFKEIIEKKEKAIYMNMFIDGTLNRSLETIDIIVYFISSYILQNTFNKFFVFLQKTFFLSIKIIAYH